MRSREQVIREWDKIGLLRRVMAMVLPLSVTEEDDDQFEHRLENSPCFLARVERARKAFQEGKGIRLEDIKWDDEEK